ncbi:AbrB family transcriptional regulator [Cytobacillus sp. S13-E01]|uniref:AbrB family transcriptional regulator n=1 Tax=Cytobacillus sp. S13-E01 TaxID=3031326 RepID=UPI0023D7DF19|nr:AbrB family transcriptional regulator [Cytobacillus sp. S13-E01]MDF0725463.1 AbrB family transcriptional regulator [Cytobacillus sp. S13-E01]
MTKIRWKKILETYSVAAGAGVIFHLLNLPIPWILGPMTAMILWKTFTHREMVAPRPIYNGGLMLLGIFFGMSFTAATFTTVFPYIIPFILTTVLLLTVSVLNAILVTRFIKIDPITSVFGSIPGGLSEMVASCESLHANTAMVTIFQTVRLLTVVFTVPFLVVHMFTGNNVSPLLNATENLSTPTFFSYAWFLIPIAVGWLLRNRLPAAYVIGPLAATALLKVIGIEIPSLSQSLLIFAQISVGMSMGNKISIQDLKLGGKYCGIYFLLSIIIIATAFGLGYLFYLYTNLSLSTAVLSLAPGGLVEMVLTAKSVGADPAVVSSLQFIRLLFIIIFVPSILKWGFTKQKPTNLQTSREHSL